MSVYVKEKTKSSAIIGIPSILAPNMEAYEMRYWLVKTGKSVSAQFFIPKMELYRNEARQLTRGFEMLANFAGKAIGKKIRRGGGFWNRNFEKNDGEYKWWLSKSFDYCVSRSVGRDIITVPMQLNCNPGTFMLINKQVGRAVKFRADVYERIAKFGRL